MTHDLAGAATLALQAALGAGVGLLFALWLRRSVERAAGRRSGTPELLLGAAMRVAVMVAALWAIGLGAPWGVLAAALGFGLGRWLAARRLSVGTAR